MSHDRELGESSKARVRLALLVAVLLVLQPGALTPVALLSMATLFGVLLVSMRWHIEAAAIAVLVLVGLVLRLGTIDRVESDVLDVTTAAIHRVLTGGNPYGVGYEASRPPGAPFPYGPLALLWYLPFVGISRLAELLACTAIIGALAVRRRFLGLAIYATAPTVVGDVLIGANDTSAGLLIFLALVVAARRPVAGAVVLALAVAFKPYALAWVPPMLWWAGLPAALAFGGASLVAWSPVLFVWGPGAFIRSVELAGHLSARPFNSLGVIWEAVSGGPAPADLLDRARLGLGALSAALGLRSATSIDAVIVLGTLTFVVTLYAGFYSPFGYLAALAPIICWRLDDWLLAVKPKTADTNHRPVAA